MLHVSAAIFGPSAAGVRHDCGEALLCPSSPLAMPLIVVVDGSSWQLERRWALSAAVVQAGDGNTPGDGSVLKAVATVQRNSVQD